MLSKYLVRETHLERQSLGLGDKVPDKGSGTEEDGSKDEVGLGGHGGQSDRHNSDDREGAEPLRAGVARRSVGILGFINSRPVRLTCHIKQTVIETILYRAPKISEIKVKGTEFQPKQYQAA